MRWQFLCEGAQRHTKVQLQLRPDSCSVESLGKVSLAFPAPKTDRGKLHPGCLALTPPYLACFDTEKKIIPFPSQRCSQQL